MIVKDAACAAGLAVWVLTESVSTRPLPVRPVMVPPTVKVLVVQVTTTLVILAVVTVPEPAVTTQFCVGFVG